MAAKRNSTTAMRFFGADVSARLAGSAFSNVVRDGQGTERPRSPDRQRFEGVPLEPASINASQFEIAQAHLQRRGAEPLAARAMALVLLDVARVLGISVMRLLDQASDEQLKLVELEAYLYVNRLRDATSQLSSTRPTSNTNSYRARYLLP